MIICSCKFWYKYKCGQGFALWCQLGVNVSEEGRGCCVNLWACCCGENDNEDLMALSDSREMCNCMITARGGYKCSKSGTQDRRTDTDSVKIKFMLSLQWFPLAVAHVFDLDAVAAKYTSPPSLSLVMADVVCESQDIPGVGWQHFSISFTAFSFWLCLNSFSPFISLCL